MHFEFTDQETLVIAKALGNAPYAEVATLFSNMQKQINQQQAVAAEVVGANTSSS